MSFFGCWVWAGCELSKVVVVVVVVAEVEAVEEEQQQKEGGGERQEERQQQHNAAGGVQTVADPVSRAAITGAAAGMMVGGVPGALVGGAAGALATTTEWRGRGGEAGEAARAVSHSVSDALVAGLVSSGNAIGAAGALVGGAAGALVSSGNAIAKTEWRGRGGEAGEAARAVAHSVSDALVAGLVSSSNAIAKQEVEEEDRTRVRGVSRGNSKFMRVKGGTAQLVVDKPQATGLEASLKEQERKESARREAKVMGAQGSEATATASSNGTTGRRGGLQASQPMEPRSKALKEEDLGACEHGNMGTEKMTFEL
jgi:hypothetical protein